MAAVALLGGRVIDPETGLDVETDVLVDDGRIVAIGGAIPAAAERIDVRGCVVGPGLIDLHSHAQSLAGLRLQALDGVTCALELEEGALPSADVGERHAARGRPIRFGFSSSWVAARMHVLDGAPLRDAAHPEGAATALEMFSSAQRGPRWQRPATAGEIARIVELLRADLRAGGLGIGMLLGYAPAVGTDEVIAVAALAAEQRVPLFVHARSMQPHHPPTLLDAVEELVEAALGTGAHIHLCHLNSTSHRHGMTVLARVRRAVADGARISTEAYPFGFGCTQIGAAFLDPAALHRQGLAPQRITLLGSAEPVADAAELARLRSADPSRLCTVAFLDESIPEEAAVLHDLLAAPEVALASDAMPFEPPDGLPVADELWPLPPGLSAHPRSSGCYARAWRLLTGPAGPGPVEFFRKASLLPASILAEVAPELERRGRLRAGADADLVVLDPAFGPRGSTLSTAPSVGVRHLLVAGRSVVREGVLDPAALDGERVIARR
ncbi:MAG: amidohydrolase family protein [Microbacteriaceae bacterium]